MKRISQLTLGTCLAIAALITANAPIIWASDDAANLLKHDTGEAIAAAGIATSFTVQ